MASLNRTEYGRQLIRTDYRNIYGYTDLDDYFKHIDLHIVHEGKIKYVNSNEFRDTLGVIWEILEEVLATNIAITAGILPDQTGKDGKFLMTDGSDTSWQYPLTGIGSIVTDHTNREVSLENDNAAPGNNYMYGTNGTGTKGWFTITNYINDSITTTDNIWSADKIQTDLGALEADLMAYTDLLRTDLDTGVQLVEQARKSFQSDLSYTVDWNLIRQASIAATDNDADDVNRTGDPAYDSDHPLELPPVSVFPNDAGYVTAASVNLISNFRQLSDTPNNFTGAAGYLVAVNSTPDGLEFIDPSTLGSNNFIGLTDTPGVIPNGEIPIGDGAGNLIFTSSLPQSFITNLTTDLGTINTDISALDVRITNIENNTIDIFAVPTSVKGYLEDVINWNAGTPDFDYAGPAITGTFAGMVHYDANYYFYCVNDNVWIRTPRA